jgi:phospholipid:diacylglycerol acyltransferase
MDMAAYDWYVLLMFRLIGRRLAYYNLEIRDSYFSRLKAKIESMKKHNGKKVVMCTHSYVPNCLEIRELNRRVEWEEL